jgi:prepilin-type N-terminal cleavage/methylation domain-containing protein
MIETEAVKSLRNGGFTLLELMVALGMGCVAGGALLLLFHHFQVLVLRLDSLTERDQNAALAPVLFVNWVAPAGCNLAGDVGPVLTAESGVLSVRTDIDGPEGFPDGALEDGFESIHLRAAGGSLQLRSGGGTFQPFLKNVDAVSFSRPAPKLLRVEMEFAGEARSGRWRAGTRRSELLVYLWNPVAWEGGDEP